jgi:hypothetical protein
MKISHKLSLSLAIFTIGFFIFGGVSFLTLKKVKVNGMIYQEIVQGKDLIADILPPPDYIIESYLTLFELRDMMENEEQVNILSEYLINKLKKEYYERHEFWVQDDILLPKFPAIREAMINKCSRVCSTQPMLCSPRQFSLL